MEENKEEKKTEYTGEYGNSVEGSYEDRNSSTYSYSYQDSNAESTHSTHSGDFYGNEYDQNKQNAASGAEHTGNAQKTEHADTAGNGFYEQKNHENMDNASQPMYHYNDSRQQNTRWSEPTPVSRQKKQKNRRPLSFGQKIAVTAVCAVLFGVIAGVCFVGVNLISQRLLGNTKDNVRLNTTTNNSANNAVVTTGSAIESNEVTAITEQSMPAIVAITSTTKGADYYDLFGQYYQGQDTTSCGSGFIVGQNEKELLIATNNHVIDGAKTISVQFIDGEVYEAEKKGADSTNDLAVIAVKTAKIKKTTMSKIKIADLGNSSEVKVGEKVIAIGNALGYGQSVTVGYISAKDREITESSENNGSQNKIKAIQTDAAINPGNSGGALINMKGQVIGINSAKIADSAVEGVGYAIPISVATPIIDELMNREALEDSEKGYLGISGQTVTDAGKAYNVPYGVYVSEVAKGGAADKAGIKVNDVITAVNKMEVTTMESLQEKINSYRKGTKVEITLKRSNNGGYAEKKVTVTLQGSESLDSLSNGDTSNQGSGNNGENNNRNNNNGNNNEGDQYGSGEDGDNGNLYEDFWNDFFR